MISMGKKIRMEQGSEAWLEPLYLILQETLCRAIRQERHNEGWVKMLLVCITYSHMNLSIIFLLFCFSQSFFLVFHRDMGELVISQEDSSGSLA